ncbi:hypothetical protein IEQ34_015194 [Dendrobium chrysotoxum]|uniref:Uncharacterized protein n=1 Tax=Dendrobium chrysotoxum TaxID=161865 RepID=A0AAV7GI48_DENCH|nr:hypothetical protein IEQ34_015194 [Dendrobium chrysotoxum]
MKEKRVKALVRLGPSWQKSYRHFTEVSRKDIGWEDGWEDGNHHYRAMTLYAIGNEYCFGRQVAEDVDFLILLTSNSICCNSSTSARMQVYHHTDSFPTIIAYILLYMPAGNIASHRQCKRVELSSTVKYRAQTPVELELDSTEEKKARQAARATIQAQSIRRPNVHRQCQRRHQVLASPAYARRCQLLASPGWLLNVVANFYISTDDANDNSSFVSTGDASFRYNLQPATPASIRASLFQPATTASIATGDANDNLSFSVSTGHASLRLASVRRAKFSHRQRLNVFIFPRDCIFPLAISSASCSTSSRVEQCAAIGIAASKKATSRSAKVGLQFPVSRIGRFFKVDKYSEHVGAGVPVYMATDLEYLAVEQGQN